MPQAGRGAGGGSGAGAGRRQRAGSRAHGAAGTEAAEESLRLPRAQLLPGGSAPGPPKPPAPGEAGTLPGTLGPAGGQPWPPAAPPP